VTSGQTCSGRGLCINSGCVCVARVGGSYCSVNFMASIDTLLAPDSPLIEDEASFVHLTPRRVDRALGGAAGLRRRLLYQAASLTAPQALKAIHFDNAAIATDLAAEANFPLTRADTLRVRHPAERAPSARTSASVWQLRPTSFADQREPQATQVLGGVVPLLETITAPPVVAPVCLGGCSGHGSCSSGKCFCEPGYVESDCARELVCTADCLGHGVCTFGLCFCGPGRAGIHCEEAAPCLAGCSGRGSCSSAKCFCDYGWQGADCSLPAPLPDTGAMPAWYCSLAQMPVALLGALLGWSVKLFADIRQRRKMRKMLQQEAQRPFVSGLRVC